MGTSIHDIIYYQVDCTRLVVELFGLSEWDLLGAVSTESQNGLTDGQTVSLV